jgi:hypothetical protein
MKLDQSGGWSGHNREREIQHEKAVRTRPDVCSDSVPSDNAVGRARWAGGPSGKQVRGRVETRHEQRMATQPCNRAADGNEHAPDDSRPQALRTGDWRAGHTLDPRICRGIVEHIVAPAAFALADVLVVVDELDPTDPFGHLIAQLALHTQA